ncbi:unnamed protein product [Nesidiocoris tenuis]|uniref:Uncharacterized protein n=1 Tax=Nesidiocoris tenuis TaxID=355587 RepID=A0A6H5GVS0_9HEMI|nr:unnamed protein product [Nesidiocoris tenuis]CAB0005393.1 unnamed protein product [Nesidiocoris tenuis]
MAVAQNFHALQYGLPGFRPPVVPVHNVVVQRSTDGSNCARTSVHLAQEFLPPFPLSGSVRPAVGPINAYPPQGSQLVDLDPRHGSHYHHPTITIQSRADVGSQANFSGTYARHELTSSYYCSIPPMPRSSVIVPTPYTNLVKQEYQ